MSYTGDLKMYTRFAVGLRSFLRNRITLDDAIAAVRMRMAERENNFIRLIERGVFNHPPSPYLSLFKLAQVELDDIRSMIGKNGLESTLRALREAGVYITFEEFKGRQPIVRNGKVIQVRPEDFDNPFLTHFYRGETSGATGAGSRVGIDLDHLAANAELELLGLAAHDLVDSRVAVWRAILSDSSGVNVILRFSRFGNVPERWFSPITSRNLAIPLRHRIATQYIVYAGRAAGVRIPKPENVGLEQASIVAGWMASVLRAGSTCMISTIVSLAARVSLAACEQGIDLRGATFLLGGEPPTPAKAMTIAQAGARSVPHYHFKEAGRIGIGCAREQSCNDIHLFKDSMALIAYPRRVPNSDVTVDAFNFTTLLPSTPKIMLNVESDDYGSMEERSCGCPLESYGYTTHLGEIRSFSKLTGEGVTLVASEMIDILESVLPRRFGGSPLDYQILEEEDGQGLTRLSLAVSPKIQIENEEAVVEAILEALSRNTLATSVAASIWRQAKTIRVKRQEPIWSSRGKLMPLHLARRAPTRAS